MRKLYIAASILVPFAVQALLTAIIESQPRSMAPADLTVVLLTFGSYFLSAGVGFALLARAVPQPLVWGIFYFPVMLVALGVFAGS